MDREKKRLSLLSIASIPAVFLFFYGIYGGMPWDYSLTYISESTPGLASFLYIDPLRIFTNVFYNVGYLLPAAVNARGSWFGYHIIYCLLWASNPILVYWLCSLFDLDAIIAIAAALIAVSHGSDTSIGHVGQINQFGIIFWILLSMCTYLKFLQSKCALGYVLLAASISSSCLALWSYEGTLFGLLLFPVLFIWTIGRTKQWSAWLGAVCVTSPALLYSALMANRLLVQKLGNTYQEHVMRNNIYDVGALTLDYFRLLRGLVDVPGWLKFKLMALSVPIKSLVTTQFVVSAAFALVAATCASLLIASALCQVEGTKNGNGASKLPEKIQLRLATTLFCLSTAFVLPFLALENGGGYWRTQILAAPFASVLMAMFLFYLIIHLPRRAGFFSVAAGAKIFSCALVAIAMCGFTANAVTYRHYNEQWEKIRAPIECLLASIPSVKPGTIIMLQGVPVGSAPWGDNFWFDMLLRLAYPNTLVAGSYSFELTNTSPEEVKKAMKSGGNIFQLQNGRQVLTMGGTYLIVGSEVKFLKSRLPTLIKSAGIDKVIVLKWRNSAPFWIIRDADEIELAVAPHKEYYDPDRRVSATGISNIARRRFFQ